MQLFIVILCCLLSGLIAIDNNSPLCKLYPVLNSNEISSVNNTCPLINSPSVLKTSSPVQKTFHDAPTSNAQQKTSDRIESLRTSYMKSASHQLIESTLNRFISANITFINDVLSRRKDTTHHRESTIENGSMYLIIITIGIVVLVLEGYDDQPILRAGEVRYVEQQNVFIANNF